MNQQVSRVALNQISFFLPMDQHPAGPGVCRDPRYKHQRMKATTARHLDSPRKDTRCPSAILASVTRPPAASFPSLEKMRAAVGTSQVLCVRCCAPDLSQRCQVLAVFFLTVGCNTCPLVAPAVHLIAATRSFGSVLLPIKQLPLSVNSAGG